MSGARDPEPLDGPAAPADEVTIDEFYDRAPCGYLSLVGDGRITRVNQTFLDWVAMDREALLDGMRFSELLTIGGRIYYETHCAPLLAMAGSVREVALDVKCGDGRRLPVLVGAEVTQRAENGSPSLIRVTVFDASHRRRYERDLLASRDADRRAREQAELLRHLADRLASQYTGKDIEAVLLEESRLWPWPVTLALDWSAFGGRAAERSFSFDAAAAETTAVLPMIVDGGASAGAVRLVAQGELLDDEREFLGEAAALAGRAFERGQRLMSVRRAGRGSNLTGLPNRRWWQSALEREVEKAKAADAALSVVLIDIDHFERFSQQQGHVAGDRLLLQVSDAWRRAGVDLLSRHGGEEFAALLPGVGLREARELVTRLRRGVSAATDFSAGVVEWDGAESGASLVARADVVLDEEKRRRLAPPV